jgi:hypothetical protein
MSIVGGWGFVYCGAVDLGVGAFTADLGIGAFTIDEKGNVIGRDYSGVAYSGTPAENQDGTITMEFSVTVPAGVHLVQGTTPMVMPLDRKVSQTFPPQFGAGAPIEVGQPPVRVMIRRVPPYSALLLWLKVSAVNSGSLGDEPGLCFLRRRPD